MKKENLLFLVIILLAVATQAANWYVSPIGNNANTGTSADPWSSINYAINTGVVSAGDTIIIAAGSYYENITTSKAITLAGAGQNDTIIYPAWSKPTGPRGSGGASDVIRVTADYVVIHDLTVDGDNPSLYSGVSSSGADLDARNGVVGGGANQFEVYNVTVRNIYLRGIYAANYGNFNFHDNIVSNVQADASSIAIFNFGGSGTFARNSVNSCNDGISANHSAGTQFIDNIIIGCGSGIHTDNAGDGGGSGDLIQGNTVVCNSNWAYGIWIFIPYLGPTIKSNSVTVTANNPTVLTMVAGGLATPAETVFSNNTINGGGYASTFGFYQTNDEFGSGAQNCATRLNDNVITNTDFGCYLDESTGCKLTCAGTGNYINNNSYGLYVAGEASALFNSNNFTGNSLYGIYNQNSVSAVTATNCWWGNSSGPNEAGNPSGTGDRVSSLVVYDPWAGGAVPVELSAFNAED